MRTHIRNSPLVCTALCRWRGWQWRVCSSPCTKKKQTVIQIKEVKFRPKTDDHDFQTKRTTANAEATWKVKQDVDFALSASHDSTGNSRVGAGLRIRF